MQFRKFHAIAGAMALVAFGAAGAGTAAAASGGHAPVHRSHEPGTATPIKHLVVIFDENVSFDHYFGTYPFAANLPGEPKFHAAPGTPTVNGLYDNVTPAAAGPLLTSNPNGSNPLRIPPNDPMTCDQDHGYTHEQSAADHGAEDAYPASVGHSLTLTQCLSGFTSTARRRPFRPAVATPRPCSTTTTAIRSRRCGITRSTSRWATTCTAPITGRRRPALSTSPRPRRTA